MRTQTAMLTGLLIAMFILPQPVVLPAETISAQESWTFDRDQPGTLPEKFSMGTLFDGRQAGDWRVLSTQRAKSPPNVLAQVMGQRRGTCVQGGVDQEHRGF
jgi:hypothetical protein